MGHRVRAAARVFVALMATMLIGVVSAFVSALAIAATAFIVPGTGTPNANIVDGYRQNARDRYMQGTACSDDQNCPDDNLVGIDYPASFWPLSILPGWCEPGRCEKWNDSVGEGTGNLIAALQPFLNPASEEEVVLFGYSQGGAVIANTLAYLNQLNLPDATKNRLEVVTIGGIENPDGGLWQRFAGWWPSWLGPVPILDISFDPAMAVDTGIRATAIGFDYDPVMYAPRYLTNPFALLNALAAFVDVHGYYLSPNGNDETATLPYGYTPETLAPQLDCEASPANCRYDTYGNTYIKIPATSLPLADLILSLADSTGTTAIVKPFVDLLAPVTRVLVDLGYDWSGDPGVPQAFSVLPFNPWQNWVAVGIKLAVAALQGVQAFLADLGTGAGPESAGTIAPSTPGPALLAAEVATPPVAGGEQHVTAGGGADTVAMRVFGTDFDTNANPQAGEDVDATADMDAPLTPAVGSEDAAVSVDDTKVVDTKVADGDEPGDDAKASDGVAPGDDAKASYGDKARATDDVTESDDQKSDISTPKKKSWKPAKSWKSDETSPSPKAPRHLNDRAAAVAETPSEKTDSDDAGVDKAA
jgi:hypothetical protein